MVNGYQIYLMRNNSTYHMFEKLMALVDGHPEVDSLTNCHNKYMFFLHRLCLFYASHWCSIAAVSLLLGRHDIRRYQHALLVSVALLPCCVLSLCFLVATIVENAKRLPVTA